MASDGDAGAGRRRSWRQWLRLGLEALGVVAAVAGVLQGVCAATDWSWQACVINCEEPPPLRVDAASSRFDAPGSDDPVQEFVCLVSISDEPVDLVRWQLRDGAGRTVNTLPSFTLAPGTRVRVHPGAGPDSPTDLFGANRQAVWTNTGDSVHVVDADGDEVDSASYGPQEETAHSDADCS